MKRIFHFLMATACPLLLLAQGWPNNYGGVMLQGFFWDSYAASRWSNLESQADELAQYFDLVWIPQSARAKNATSMGYDPLYWFSNYNSSFGTEAELRSMISTFKNKGIGTIADVVINHRGNVSNRVDFPAETYKGVTYELKSTDICKNDDGGATLTWANANGYSLSANNDTGEGWDGMRDLDHNSVNVQTNVHAYLDFLLNDLGYAGFRYDMTKGYSASFTGMYNAQANPTYSVGEYWDGNAATVKTWLSGTRVNGAIQSAAFDFPFRYTARDVVNNSTWTALGGTSLMNDASYRRYAVTFIENHDTERRSSAEQDPIKADTLALNAFMLAAPGTPCVFLKHWIDCKRNIKAMIDVRKAVGVTNTSTFLPYRSNKDYYAAITTGAQCRVLTVVGDVNNPNITGVISSTQWVPIIEGYHYRYYVEPKLETPWVDVPSGEYTEAFSVQLKAVSQHTDAQLVYTTDGSEPTATHGTQVASGTSITIKENTQLKVGLLVGGTVTKIIERKYTFEVPYEGPVATIYLKDPTAEPNNWSNVYFYAWDGNELIADQWPGIKVQADTLIKGVKFYYRTFKMPREDYKFNIIFN
ncbi:MAG: chitobiase/beta-hexosaminidase C-terminal domain-containing protein, partial [Muribaculaceae bacterium]|nr:chitobiase/beta-hexosaminidase C-terminal domain-containing protein [Muribaculaceae bacterium]